MHPSSGAPSGGNQEWRCLQRARAAVLKVHHSLSVESAARLFASRHRSAAEPRLLLRAIHSWTAVSILHNPVDPFANDPCALFPAPYALHRSVELTECFRTHTASGQ